jgi:hypothetical protein
MTVNTGVKGTLAKLLATEDLIIEHRNCETASFDVQRRVLTLPVWEKATDQVYDLLVAHEVGHALYTPSEWDSFECPQSFVNVTEDARIEKLMKRRYQGLPKTFYRGYQQLNEDDFFSTSGDLDKLNLIDRINLHFKVGSFVEMPFSDEEKAFVPMVDSAETFDEAVDVAEKIFAYMKEQLENKDKQDTPTPENSADIPSDSSGNRDGIPSSGDDAVDESGDTTSSEFDIDEDGHQSDMGGNDDPLEAHTDKALQEHVKSLVENFYETEYIEIPNAKVEDVVVDHTKILESIRVSFTPSEDDPIWVKESLEQSAVDFQEFFDKSKKEVNYLVKEFECRKAADSYARQSSSRTGVLDTAKLHTYKYNEDLFKRVTVLPEGKNHGMVFVLDWSGSMGGCIIDTVKQVLQLCWFCRKTNIPFRVFTFGYSWGVFNEHRDDDCGVPGTVAFANGFALLEVLTSECNTKTFNELSLGLWRNAGAVGSVPGNWGSNYRFPCSAGMSLSGTPLIESITAMHMVLPDFIRKNRLQKVSLSILTDGESGPVSIYAQRKPLFGDRIYSTTFGRRCQLRDRKRGKIYPKFEHPMEQCNVFLENLKDNFPNVSILGFRLLPSRDARQYFRNISIMEYIPSDYQTCMNKYKKDRFFEITNSPYDRLWILPTTMLSENETFDELDEEATTAQIRTAFKKMYKNKSTNKKMLTSFARSVA